MTNAFVLLCFMSFYPERTIQQYEFYGDSNSGYADNVDNAYNSGNSYFYNNFCPALYQRYNEYHTYCLPPNPKCDIRATGVTPQEKAYIISEHNRLRSITAFGADYFGIYYPQASDMLEMVWDDELAAVAQKHAEQCVFQHDCHTCRQVENFNVGQNLFQRNERLKYEPVSDWTDAMFAWYDEIKDFNPNLIYKYDGTPTDGEYGHLTQLIWSKSWRVGCGYVLHYRAPYYSQYYSCNYGPSGNVIGWPVHDVGAPGTTCPFNSYFNPQTGLCALTGNEAPIYNDPTQYILHCTFDGRGGCDLSTPDGMPNWQVTNTLSGSYIGVVLRGGQSTSLIITPSFRSTNLMCMILLYRKGPTVAGNAAVHTAEEHFYFPESQQELLTRLDTTTNVFAKLSTKLNWNVETQISFSFEVPVGQPDQFMEIAELSVVAGSVC